MQVGTLVKIKEGYEEPVRRGLERSDWYHRGGQEGASIPCRVESE